MLRQARDRIRAALFVEESSRAKSRTKTPASSAEWPRTQDSSPMPQTLRDSRMPCLWAAKQVSAPKPSPFSRAANQRLPAHLVQSAGIRHPPHRNPEDIFLRTLTATLDTPALL